MVYSPTCLCKEDGGYLSIAQSLALPMIEKRVWESELVNLNLALEPASNASVLPWIVQPGVEYSKAGADLFLCLQ